MNRPKLMDELVAQLMPNARLRAPGDGWLDTAVMIACAVRDEPETALLELERLDGRQVRALLLCTAALVPTTRSLAELTSWLVEPRVQLPSARSWGDAELRAAHARYNRALSSARAAGVELCVDEDTRAGEREYNRRRKLARASAA